METAPGEPNWERDELRPPPEPPKARPDSRGGGAQLAKVWRPHSSLAAIND
jgi:hypothetical protein